MGRKGKTKGKVSKRKSCRKGRKNVPVVQRKGHFRHQIFSSQREGTEEEELATEGKNQSKKKQRPSLSPVHQEKTSACSGKLFNRRP